MLLVCRFKRWSEVVDHGDFAVYYSTLVFPPQNGLEYLLPFGYHGIEM